MAKTRAQRKAEKRAREAQEQKRSGGSGTREARAQHDTQVPVSGDVAEIEAVEAGIAAGAPEAELETPDAPKTTRSQRRAEAKDSQGSGTARTRRSQAPRARAARQTPEAGERRAPARRSLRLPRLLLGGAEESPVAGSRHAGPGDRGDDHLRRRRRGLPRRPRRHIQLPDPKDPLTPCIAGM